MKVLVIGGRGAVGTHLIAALSARGVNVRSAGRHPENDVRIDLAQGPDPLREAAIGYDGVVNASGHELLWLGRLGLPVVEISATSAYLDQLGRQAVPDTPVLRGAGLVPGLSTALIADLGVDRGGDIDLFVTLGSGERHGAAALDWTLGLIGRRLHSPSEPAPGFNFRSVRRFRSKGRVRTHLRADFPDHILVPAASGATVRTYLALTSRALTSALRVAARVRSTPWARTGALAARLPHIGSDRWSLTAVRRQTGESQRAEGRGQSRATGHLTALATVRFLERCRDEEVGSLTVADIATSEDLLGSVAVSDGAQ